jgi:folate-binding protein YgfZ
VVFVISGPRAGRVVNGIVTNSLDGLGEGRGAYAFALSAKGRPIAEMRVLPAPGFDSPVEADVENVWLDVPVAASEGLADLLRRSVPPIFATVELAGVRRLSLLGPSAVEGAGRILALLGIEDDLPVDPLAAVTARRAGTVQGLIVRREPIEGDGVDLYVDRDGAPGFADQLGAAVEQFGGVRCDAVDIETARVERGLPVFGVEITAENLPQETGQTERAVSFQKGCYTGQEVVARIHYRGHVNRLLRGLRPQGEGSSTADFVPGAALYFEGRVVGDVRSVVQSPRMGPLGLGYVRTSAEPGTHLSLESEGPAFIAVTELPFT